jgi:hypothetical protein
MRFDQSKTVFAGMPASQVRAWYTSAQQAYLQLGLGRREVVVSYEGKSVTYTAADAQLLRSLIDEAQTILGYGRQRRAIRPYFR